MSVTNFAFHTRGPVGTKVEVKVLTIYHYSNVFYKFGGKFNYVGLYKDFYLDMVTLVVVTILDVFGTGVNRI